MYFLSVVLLLQWSWSPSSQYRTWAVQIWCKLQWLSWSFPPLHLFRGKHPPRKRRLYYIAHFLPCPKHLDLPSLEQVVKKPWFSFSSTAWTQSVAMFCVPIFPWFETLCCLLSYLSLSSFCTNFLFLLLVSLILHRNQKCLAYVSKPSNGCADMPSNQSVCCHFCQ